MKEEELLRKRLAELADKAFTQNIYTYTHFLNEYEQSIYREMQRELSFVDSHLEGGHEYFTRAVAVFGSEDMFGYQGEIPLACARISPVFDKYAENLSHRDYLGAMMHLGIERHQLGDILVDGKDAFVFCFSHIGEVLEKELIKVRHTRVRTEITRWEESGFRQKFLIKEGFAASMRLDAIVSLAFGLSRKASGQLLGRQKVFVNGKLCLGGDSRLGTGDVVSVRGQGKFLVEGTGKHSRKGRQFIVLKIFQ